MNARVAKVNTLWEIQSALLLSAEGTTAGDHREGCLRESCEVILRRNRMETSKKVTEFCIL